MEFIDVFVEGLEPGVGKGVGLFFEEDLFFEGDVLFGEFFFDVVEFFDFVGEE